MFLSELSTGGIAVAVATAATNPIDVVKIRLQLEGAGATKGLVGTFVHVGRTEGFSAFFQGISPAIARGLFYGGLRLGMYTSLKGYVAPDGNMSFVEKLATGCTAGAVAAAVCNPFDLVKTRMQTGAGPPKTQMQVIQAVLREQGMLGLWRGTMPSAARAAALTASQCATYDEIKRQYMSILKQEDCLATHFSCAMIAGLISTTVTSPFDVMKTKMFVQHGQQQTMIQCAQKILATEGILGMFRGWTANYVRLGPQTTIIFVVCEYLRQSLGMKPL